MNTKDKGELSEAKVTARLKEKGYAVLTPFGDNQKYDLVYECSKGFQKVQVKTAKRKSGKITAKLYTSLSNTNNQESKHYTEEDIVEFMLYCPQTDEVYQMSVKEAPKSEVTIRLEPASNNQTKNINRREDYLF